MDPVSQKFPPAWRSSAPPCPESKPAASAWLGEGQLPDVVLGRERVYGCSNSPIFSPVSCPHQECCLALSPWRFCSMNPITSNPAPPSRPAPHARGGFSFALRLPVRLPLIPLLSSFLNFTPLLQVSLSLGVYAALESPFVFSSVGVRVNVYVQHQ
ncbi:hypothetical protein HJG60_007781 [Phyllostomus discolor]|uniref:Uncharacterized protein n=1 Tax=Phyllostomus discolor TaxID=89673 RepID=A0A834BDQ7_9CHIR|nr:hypothetical protein HJG60_007781 [Phyllostomus discolor]